MSPELIATAAIGKDAEEFMASDLGRVVIGIAQQEADAALMKLKTVAPWRRSRIKELQNEIWRAESFERWLHELIVEGEQALQQMESD